LEVDARASVDEEFWTQVLQDVGKERWKRLARKWSFTGTGWGKLLPGSSVSSPEFEDVVSLICWAYELFLGKQLDPNFVKWCLQIHELMPVSW